MKQELIELYKTFKEDHPDGTSFKVVFSYEELPNVEYSVIVKEVSDEEDDENDDDDV